MMENRSDFSVYNEPLLWPYTKIHIPELVEHWYYSDAIDTYPRFFSEIALDLQEKNVFIKDMAACIPEYLSKYPEYAKRPDVHFTFLVRNPHSVCISLYRKTLESLGDEAIEQLEHYVGIEELYQTYEIVSKTSPNKVMIMKSEDLVENPSKTIGAYCQHYQIPFDETKLTWKSHGENFTGVKEWHEAKLPPHTQHWHKNAIMSSGFVKPTTYEVDAKGNPTFSEITNKKHREIMRKIYEKNLVYYNRLFAQ